MTYLGKWPLSRVSTQYLRVLSIAHRSDPDAGSQVLGCCYARQRLSRNRLQCVCLRDCDEGVQREEAQSRGRGLKKPRSLCPLCQSPRFLVIHRFKCAWQQRLRLALALQLSACNAFPLIGTESGELQAIAAALCLSANKSNST